jgi:hypothetical protein
MRFVALLLLAACPAPLATKPQPVQHTTADNTCEGVAWSCVGMKPGTEDSWGCVEGNATQRTQYEGSCTAAQHGRFALNACLRDTAVGGCTLARGAACTTTWYHAPASRASVEADCAKQGALFVAP